MDVPDLRVPSSLRSALERRISSLSDDERSLLRVASLLGGVFDANELVTLVGRPSVEVLPALAELMMQGLLEEQEQTLSFRHDLIRELVYESIPASVQLSLHRDIARRLAANNAAAFRIAHHYSLAGSAVADEASEWLVRSARRVTAVEPARPTRPS